MAVIFVWNEEAVDRTLHRRDGMVGREIESRATRVMLAAQAQAGISSGALKISIHKNFNRGSSGPNISVGSDLSYALLHHEGTKPHVIVAKTGGVLRFRGKGGKTVYTHVVINRGTRPNKYLTDNLELALIPGAFTPSV